MELFAIIAAFAIGGVAGVNITLLHTGRKIEELRAYVNGQLSLQNTLIDDFVIGAKDLIDERIETVLDGADVETSGRVIL